MILNHACSLVLLHSSLWALVPGELLVQYFIKQNYYRKLA